MDRNRTGRLLLLAAWLVAALASPAGADVYKYVDADGNVYFSDEPLSKPNLQLEWKRSSARLVTEHQRSSEELRRRQAESQARLQTRLRNPLDAHPDVYARRPPASLVSGSMATRRARYEGLIQAAARRHRVPAELLHAVIRAESAYRPDALSHAGACGLMQLMPGTARRFHVRDIWDPAENIRGGATYLRLLLDMFDNDLRLALAAYNAGEGAVKRYGNQIPPFRETQGYVRTVLQFLSAERGLYSGL